MIEKIYHITTKAAWNEAKAIGFYHDSSLDKDGFIHCSYPQQIARVANHHFKGHDNLLILGINRNQTNCEVVDEDLYNLNERFSHVYGPVPVNAVFDVVSLICDDEGCFSLPNRIRA